MKLSLGAKIGLAVGLIGALIGLAAAFQSDPVIGGVVAVLLTLTFSWVFTIFFRPMMRLANLEKELALNGKDATAIVLELRDTGVSINDNPQIELMLEVQPPNGKPFHATLKQIVSRLQTSAYQPGNTLQVRYDPTAPSKVIVTGTGAAGANALAQDGMKRMLEELQEEQQRLITNGTAAKATILNSWNMGVNVNGDNPLMGFLLEVQPGGDEKFLAETKGAVRHESLGKYQIGKTVAVKYDPANKEKVTIYAS